MRPVKPLPRAPLPSAHGGQGRGTRDLPSALWPVPQPAPPAPGCMTILLQMACALGLQPVGAPAPQCLSARRDLPVPSPIDGQLGNFRLQSPDPCARSPCLPPAPRDCQWWSRLFCAAWVFSSTPGLRPLPGRGTHRSPALPFESSWSCGLAWWPYWPTHHGHSHSYRGHGP